MSEMQRERDLVLNPNEYAYVLDKTKGLISCVVGPNKMSLSNSDALVTFDEKSKRFEEASYGTAVTTFVAVPENWYVELKNPCKDPDKRYPLAGASNSLPSLLIGKKINIRGNVSFALYPGQMAKVIQGHRLHSNQYLLARVYDADSLNKEVEKEWQDYLKLQSMERLEKEKNKAQADESMQSHMPDAVGNLPYDSVDSESVAEPTEETTTEMQQEPEKYVTGQILVIKGTDVQFYIPPTGIEVIPVGGYGNKYVRDAVTLERLEYCILKNEKGVKKYIHGDAVVFPQPDEVFVKNKSIEDIAEGSDIYKFRAIELSDISGVYVKVISDYTDEDGKSHKAGDELFITGKEQMIYYPRPEHAIIDYEGQVVSHAIAIPAGEGRYILERMKGNVKLIKGPNMYLPDPRTEVVVQRKLSRKECRLWFPGNSEVVEFNENLAQDSRYSDRYEEMNDRRMAEATELGFSRKNSYTKPRTLILDNKYDGAVAINIWTGYAVNVVSKGGKRKVVTGPTTYLMEYDETLEAITLSTGKPKTTDNVIETVYLRVDNNKISDLINVQTKDFVNVTVKVSYCVDFLEEYKDKWFDVENYVKYMTDRQRSLLKMEAKKHNIEDFYKNTTSIVRNTLLNLNGEGKGEGRLFAENGMLVKDVEVLSVSIEDDVERIINKHQYNMVQKSLELTNADKSLEVAKKLQEVEKEKAKLEYENKLYQLHLDTDYQKQRMERDNAIKRMEEEELSTQKTAEYTLQEVLDEIQKAEVLREKELHDARIARVKEADKLEMDKQKAYTDSIKKVVESVSPDLIAAMTSKSNSDLIQAVAKSMGPYAIAKDSSIADVTNKLLRGTVLEQLMDKLDTFKGLSGTMDGEEEEEVYKGEENFWDDEE